MTPESSEIAMATELAGRVLDRPHADPDDDLALLARQFLRLREERERLVDALPKTADGVSIVPGMIVYDGSLALLVVSVRRPSVAQPDGRRPQDIGVTTPGEAGLSHLDWSHLVYADLSASVLAQAKMLAAGLAP